MSKVVAIVQSNYIPWKGYFDLIRQSDEFILYDDAQYTKNDWRNRNQIKTQHGPKWLTIPIELRGKFAQKIKDARVADPHWAKSHWSTLQQSYAKAPYFAQYRDLLEGLYRTAQGPLLSDINRAFLEGLGSALGIKTRLTCSMDYTLAAEDPTGRVVELCVQAGATEYLSGPAAKAYLDESAFERVGIRVRYIDYSGYPEHPQLYPPFTHAVSVIDLLLMTGPGALSYMERQAAAA
jgi:hypothetical protein